MHSNKYLITREVWDRGERVVGNSIRKAIMSYAWDNKEQPKKDGREDPLDALRYDCIFHHWSDTHRKYQAKSSKVNRSVKVGSAKKRNF
ncbi:MAG: hypothetical protein EBU35_11320 [Marivivens sp.]|jgi:hypothetical protein|nr:hypothetical protein [Marivivens sp.]